MMENPEAVLHSLEEFAKMKPKDIPRELEEYLKLVAKTGDPVYQWSAIKSLFREKLISVITEFYESCASVEIPPCPNVDLFNYDLVKNFILEKLDTFSSAPFTLQRICELLTDPRKEYTRIDKYMRALEKNILVVSTMEPGGRRTENGEGIMNGIESDHDHVPEPGNEINVEEIDNSLLCPQNVEGNSYINDQVFDNSEYGIETSIDTYTSEKVTSEASTSSQEIVCVQYVSIEPLPSGNVQQHQNETVKDDVSVTITAVNIERITETHIESRSEDSKVEKTESEESSNVKQKSENESDFETKMDIQPAEPAPSESNEPDSCEEATSELPTSESDADSASSKVDSQEDTPDKVDDEKSLESSITCSESIPNQSETADEVPDSDTTENKPASEIEIEKTDNEVSTSPTDSEAEILDTVVDSTTTSEAKTLDTPDDTNDSELQLNSEVIVTPAESTDEQQILESEADSSTVSKEAINTEQEEEVTNQENNAEASEEMREVSEHSKTEEATAHEENEQVSSVLNEDKPTPMEVDADSGEAQEAESSSDSVA